MTCGALSFLGFGAKNYPKPRFMSHAMTVKPTRQRIKFGELTVGQRFYDPISAEYFIKQSDQLAAMVTGIGDGTIPDEFDADDIVGIDL